MTDNSGAAGAIGTTLTTVSVDGAVGTTNLYGNAITNVNVANGATITTVTSTNVAVAAHTLNISGSVGLTGCWKTKNVTYHARI